MQDECAAAAAILEEKGGIPVAGESIAWADGRSGVARRMDRRSVEEVSESGDAMTGQKLTREALLGNT